VLNTELPSSYTTLADSVAGTVQEMTGIPIPDSITPELDDLLVEWLARHNLRIERPLDRFVQVDADSDKRWKHVSATDWQAIETMRAGRQHALRTAF
jgi:hypothetical protein